MLILGGGKSCWGPTDGETLQLITANKGQRVPTGTFLAVRVVMLEGDEWDGVVQLAFSDVPCPNCGQTEALAQCLAVGEQCPKCKSGVIAKRVTCIY